MYQFKKNILILVCIFFYFVNMETAIQQAHNNPALEYNKNQFGRPLKFTTPKDLQDAIDNYFNSCLKPALNEDGSLQTDKNGNVIYEQFKPFTITGLAVALDTNRQTLLNYATRADFFDIIARAKEKCENYAEDSLFDRNKARGAEFVLNTSYAQWTPTKDITGQQRTIVEHQISLNTSNLTGDDLRALSEAFKRAGLLQDAQVTDIQTDNPKTQENAQKEDK